MPRGKRPASPGLGFRFYLDEDLPPGAAEVARGLGLDVVSAREVGPTAQPDGVHLAIAAAKGRIVATYNRDDFIELTRDAFAAGRPHAGVFIFTYKLPRNAERVAHALFRWAASAAHRFGPPPLQPYLIDFPSH